MKRASVLNSRSFRIFRKASERISVFLPLGECIPNALGLSSSGRLCAGRGSSSSFRLLGFVFSKNKTTKKRNEPPKEWRLVSQRGMATAAMGSGFAFETKSRSSYAGRKDYAPTMTWTTRSAPPKTNRKPTIGSTNFNQCVYFMSNMVSVAMTSPVGAR